MRNQSSLSLNHNQESYLRKVKRFFRGSPTDWHYLQPRTIEGYTDNMAYPNNKTTTSKYTIISFIPLNLYEQFSKIANIYFLACGILQMVFQIPAISTTNGIPTEYTPLVFIVIVTAIKDIYEDYQRHRTDSKENNQIVQKGRLKINLDDTLSEMSLAEIQQLENAVQWTNIRQQDIRVGNIIRIQENQLIPADCIILRSSLPYGHCFIETAQLDGETNLKTKFASQHRACFENNTTVEAEEPNPYLYKFKGSINVKPEDEENQIATLELSNFLLRGCQLKNTEFVIALVVYTGHQTKIMLNSHNPRGKTTDLCQKMNKLTLVVWLCQWVICAFCALIRQIKNKIHFSKSVLWFKQKYQETPYLEENSTLIGKELIGMFFLRMGNWFILFVNFLPISMMITLDMIRLFQAQTICNDSEMISTNKPTVQSSNLNDDLGQISDVFSDKTGTLTCNCMSFRFVLSQLIQEQRCLWVNGVQYGSNSLELKNQMNIIQENVSNEPLDDIYKMRFWETQKEIKLREENINTKIVSNQSTSNKFLVQKGLKNDQIRTINFMQKEYLNQVNNQTVENVNFYDSNYQTCLKTDQKITQALLVFALCNDIIIETKQDKINYKASSPDELALINFALYSGVKLLKKSLDGNITLMVHETVREFILLNTLEFTSSRKRMSVIVQDQENRIYLMCKGADSVIIPKINQKQNQQLLQNLEETLSFYSKQGLRTLVLGMKELDQNEYLQWNEKYLQCQNLIDQREDKMEIIMDQIEQELQLVGASAVEDKLQNNVPQTIQKLREANINLWVLTGDKKETALNIGYSTGIVSQQDQIYELDHDISILTKEPLSQKHDACLLVSGDFLVKVKEQDMADKFIEYARQFRAVIASRVSPKQKREIVEIYRKSCPQRRVLAIGDGANDVNMITEANVGIGIIGVEGTQAARASDYAIPEFQCLERLLLFHGRESYSKNSQVVLYNFYKNILYLFPQLWFGFTNGFCGQSLYDLYIFQCYNLFYTSLPIVVFGVLDLKYWKISEQTISENYLPGQRCEKINYKALIIWCTEGILQSLIIFISTLFIFGTQASNGINSDMVTEGQIVYCLAVIIANFKILQISNCLPLCQIITLGISVGSYLLSILILNVVVSYMLYEVFSVLFRSLQFYLVFIFGTFFSVFLQIAFERFKQLCRQTTSTKTKVYEYTQKEKDLSQSLLG